MLSQAAARSLGPEIKARLNADCTLCATMITASNVEGCLMVGEFIEAWHHLKGWYCSAEDRSPTPCPETLAKQMQERIDFYATCQPLGVMLLFHVKPAPLTDVAPPDSELQMVVGQLRNSCDAGLKAQMKADRLLRAMTTALNVEGCLADGEYIEAWHHLKGWYCLVEDQAPMPCPETLAKQMEEQIDLYTARQPPGVMLPLHIDPALIPDAAPMDSELQMVVGQTTEWLCRGCDGE